MAKRKAASTAASAASSRLARRVSPCRTPRAARLAGVEIRLEFTACAPAVVGVARLGILARMPNGEVEQVEAESLHRELLEGLEAGLDALERSLRQHAAAPGGGQPIGLVVPVDRLLLQVARLGQALLDPVVGALVVAALLDGVGAIARRLADQEVVAGARRPAAARRLVQVLLRLLRIAARAGVQAEQAEPGVGVGAGEAGRFAELAVGIVQQAVAAIGVAAADRGVAVDSFDVRVAEQVAGPQRFVGADLERLRRPRPRLPPLVLAHGGLGLAEIENHAIDVQRQRLAQRLPCRPRAPAERAALAQRAVGRDHLIERLGLGRVDLASEQVGLVPHPHLAADLPRAPDDEPEHGGAEEAAESPPPARAGDGRHGVRAGGRAGRRRRPGGHRDGRRLDPARRRDRRQRRIGERHLRLRAARLAAGVRGGVGAGPAGRVARDRARHRAGQRPGTSGGTPGIGGSASARAPLIGLVGAWPRPASVRRVGLMSGGRAGTSAPTGDVRRVVSRQRRSVSRASPADASRIAGLRASRRWTSATRSPGQSAGSAGGPLSICRSTSRSLPWKGGAPASISHSTTPSDQQSLIALTWPSMRRSGDM